MPNDVATATPATPAGAPANPTPATPTPSQNGDWRASLPEDVRGDPVIGKYANVGELARGFVNAQKMIGATKLPLPSDKATDAEWDMVYSRLGRPESPDKYKMERPADFTGTYDEGFVKAFLTEAHGAGLNQRQVDKLTKWYFGQQGAAEKNHATNLEGARQEAEMTLRREWGRSYDQNLRLAASAMNKFFDESDKARIDQLGLGDDPGFIRMLLKVSRATEDDTMDGKPSSPATGANEAKRRVAEIMGDMNHPYWQGQHPAHKQAVEEVLRLREIAEGAVR